MQSNSGRTQNLESASHLQALAPHPQTVLMDISNKCNLKCRMCYFNYDAIFNRPAIHMSVVTFAAVGRQIFPYAKTVFLSAAAEPLVHPQFAEILAITAQYKPEQIKFLTNAQLLTPALSRACILHGVTEIHVSLDGAKQETYEWARCGASFDRLINNLLHLKKLKQELGSSAPIVQFNITLMRRNVGELGAFARLAQRLGAERLACRHLLLYAGLNMESESLAADKAWANEQMARGLCEVAGTGISVVQFPNFFTSAETHAPPWSGFGPSEIHEAPREKQNMVWPVAAQERPSRTTWHLQLASVQRRLWHALPPRARWPLQSFRLRHPMRWENERPIGCVDEPVEHRMPAFEGFLFAGWALYRHGIERVSICREPLPGERVQAANELGLISLGEAQRHSAARPDVVLKYPDYQDNLLAGWTFRLAKKCLPTFSDSLRLHIVAWGKDGCYAVLGHRIVTPPIEAQDAGVFYCRKPFTSVYIDPSAHVFPHPDCQNSKPFGTLADGQGFEEIWNGNAFVALRRQIAQLDPPEMCRACPDFINRNVDDPIYFAPRRLDSPELIK